MKIDRIIAYSSLIISVSIAILFAIETSTKEKTGFVDVGKIYREFKMTAYYQGRLDAEDKSVKQALDSLMMQRNKLLSASAGKNNIAADSIEHRIGKIQEAYARRKQNVSDEYNNKILQQLNLYVQEYGEQNHYSFIFGAVGSGSLMYGDKKADITEPVLEYVNARFEGENKK